jgi:hypothetical protein
MSKGLEKSATLQEEGIMEKVALFVFNGDPMCFIHVLLNALDMADRAKTARIVVEGAATGLIADIAAEGHPLNGLWRKCLDRQLVAGVCKACSNKTGTLEAARQQGLALLDEMTGHPSMARFQQEGFTVITF